MGNWIVCKAPGSGKILIKVEKPKEKQLLTREESRKADENAIRKYCIPSLVLMENAGRTCAETLIGQGPTSPQAVIVLCGPGNNGGDGFVIARHLYIAGVKIKVVLFRKAEAYGGDAGLNLKALSRLRMSVVELDAVWSDAKIQELFAKVGRLATSWVVDALLGTGASGEPKAMMARAIQVANRMEVRRFAVDIPTGLDCDTGEPASTTFRADLTCTLIDRKAGFENKASKEFTGSVHVAGIGAPNEIFGEGRWRRRNDRGN